MCTSSQPPSEDCRVITDVVLVNREWLTDRDSPAAPPEFTDRETAPG